MTIVRFSTDASDAYGDCDIAHAELSVTEGDAFLTLLDKLRNLCIANDLVVVEIQYEDMKGWEDVSYARLCVSSKEFWFEGWVGDDRCETQATSIDDFCELIIKIDGNLQLEGSRMIDYHIAIFEDNILTIG